MGGLPGDWGVCMVGLYYAGAHGLLSVTGLALDSYIGNFLMIYSSGIKSELTLKAIKHHQKPLHQDEYIKQIVVFWLFVTVSLKPIWFLVWRSGEILRQNIILAAQPFGALKVICST